MTREFDVDHPHRASPARCVAIMTLLLFMGYPVPRKIVSINEPLSHGCEFPHHARWLGKPEAVTRFCGNLWFNIADGSSFSISGFEWYSLDLWFWFLCVCYISVSRESQWEEVEISGFENFSWLCHSVEKFSFLSPKYMICLFFYLVE